ncbi:MAG: PEP-CTERM sorting domain-containing protein [Terriglobia bacterium]
MNGTLIGPVHLTGGILSGSGTIDGDVLNGATVAPGDPTKLTINGNYTQDPNRTLVIDISSLTDFTVLDVTGTATLDGAVDFDFFDGYVPAANTAFPFLEAGYVSEDFTSLDFTGINCPTCFFDPYTLTLDIGSTPPGPSSDTPEPASMILFGTALLSMALLSRRKPVTARESRK